MTDRERCLHTLKHLLNLTPYDWKLDGTYSMKHASGLELHHTGVLLEMQVRTYNQTWKLTGWDAIILTVRYLRARRKVKRGLSERRNSVPSEILDKLSHFNHAKPK